MATADTHNFLGQTPPPRLPTEPRRQAEEVRTAEAITGGSVAEAACGLGAVVLAILSLAGLFVTFLTPIAVIALGAGMFLEGAAIAIRYSRLLCEVTGSRHATESELGGGMTAELGGGAAGVVLGILALLRVAPVMLTAIAVIVFGAALLIGCGATARLNHLVVEGWHDLHDRARALARAAVTSAAGLQVLAGLAGIVLGILALLNVFPWTLSAAALLCLGATVLLGGAAISARMMNMLRH